MNTATESTSTMGSTTTFESTSTMVGSMTMETGSVTSLTVTSAVQSSSRESRLSLDPVAVTFSEINPNKNQHQNGLPTTGSLSATLVALGQPHQNGLLSTLPSTPMTQPTSPSQTTSSVSVPDIPISPVPIAMISPQPYRPGSGKAVLRAVRAPQIAQIPQQGVQGPQQAVQTLPNALSASQPLLRNPNESVNHSNRNSSSLINGDRHQIVNGHANTNGVNHPNEISNHNLGGSQRSIVYVNPDLDEGATFQGSTTSSMASVVPDANNNRPKTRESNG